jgi:hypothetical protein
MPDFTFEGPGGQSITITGPEGATRDQAIGILRQQRPELWQQPPQPSLTSDVKDVAGSIAAGAARAPMHVPGLGGDVSALGAGVSGLMNRGVDWATAQLGVPTHLRERQLERERLGHILPTTSDIAQEVEQRTGVPVTYTGRTPAARIAGAATEGALDPVGLMTGPGTIARGMTAGALAGGTGEAVTEVTGSPVAGAIAGGAAALGRGAGAERAAIRRTNTPTIGEIESAGGGLRPGQPIRGNDMQVLNARSANLMNRIRGATRPGVDESSHEALRRGVGSILSDADAGRIAVVPDEARALREIRNGNLNVITRQEREQLETLHRGGFTRNILGALGGPPGQGHISHFLRHLFTVAGLGIPAAARAGAGGIASRGINRTLDELARASQLGTARELRSPLPRGPFTLDELVQAGVRGAESQEGRQ